MVWQIAGAGIGGMMAKSASNKAARKAIEIGNENADDLERITKLNVNEIRRIGGMNADAVVKTANLNAASIRQVGEFNAMAHIEATSMNLDLTATENLELIRRHKGQEEQMLSQQRAATGQSGVRLAGSPLEVMVQSQTEGFRERMYLTMYAAKRMNILTTMGKRKAQATWLDADLKAKVMQQVAALQASVMREQSASQAQMMLNDSEANAASLRRGGQLIAAQARAQGTASLVSGIMGGLNSAYQGGGLNMPAMSIFTPKTITPSFAITTGPIGGPI